MKAEHRKELQTNALADRMGRIIQRARQGPSRGLVTTVLLLVVVLGALLFFLWRRSNSRQADSDLWVEFNSTNPRAFAALVQESPNTSQGRGAEVQLAWMHLYEDGIKSLMANPQDALQHIKEGKKRFERVLDDVKDDPVLGPEVRYAIAVAEETLAVENPVTHLDRAAKLYKTVMTDYPNSAHAAQAEVRYKLLKDIAGRERLRGFYQQLQTETQSRRMPGGLENLTPEQRRLFEKFRRQGGL